MDNVQIDYKHKQPAADPIILKVLAIEIRGLDKSPSSFSFQSKSQKSRIPTPLIDPVKNESSKRSVLEDLELKASQASNDYASLQIDQLVVFLSPTIRRGEVSSASSYVPMYVQDKILHDCPLGTGASHNSIPRLTWISSALTL